MSSFLVFAPSFEFLEDLDLTGEDSDVIKGKVEASETPGGWHNRPLTGCQKGSSVANYSTIMQHERG